MTPAHRSAPKFSDGWFPLFGISGFGAIIVAGLVAYHTFASADVLEGLRGIEIRPLTPEERTVNPGGALRLTAMGDFATMEIPVRADWSFVGEDLGSSIEHCSATKLCTLQAGSQGGSILVRADAGEFSDEATITIHQVSPFTDNLPGWADDAILQLNQLGIIRGYENGTYGPGDPVTRGQFVTLLYRLALQTSITEELTSDLCPPSMFTDVPADHFAFLPFCFYDRTAVGSSHSTIREPDLPAPREQVATMVAQTFAPSLLAGHGFTDDRAQEPYEGGPFFDDVPTDHAAFFDTATVRTIGIMEGYPNGDFGVGDPLNRAQAAVIIGRLLQEIDDYNIEGFRQLGWSQEEEEEEEEESSIPAAVVPGIDLRVTDIVLNPTSPVFGSAFTLSFNLSNVGGAAAPTTQGRYRFDRGNNGNWDFDLTDLHATLAAGGSRTVTATLPTHHSSMPSREIPTGTHKVQVCANDPNTGFGSPAEEASRDNNCEEVVFTVIGGAPLADLNVSDLALHPDSPVFGNDFVLSFRLQNVGGAAAPLTQGRYRFDRGDNRSWDFDLVDLMSGLAAGASQTVTATLPTHHSSDSSHELPAGTHRVKACANDPNTGFGSPMEEASRENNCSEMVFTVRQE